MGYQSVLIGAVGEHLARARLQALGWLVPDGDFLGGHTADLDLIATSPVGSVTVEFQVKTTTTDGDIKWQKPGRMKVDPWIARAAAKSRLAAFIMIRADEESVWISPDVHRPGYFFPEPEILQMTAMTARDFGDLVDQRRVEYGQRTRQRLYRGQGVIGELLSPKKLLIPVYVDDGQPLENFLALLQQFPAAPGWFRLDFVEPALLCGHKSLAREPGINSAQPPWMRRRLSARSARSESPDAHPGPQSRASRLILPSRRASDWRRAAESL